MKSCWQVDFCGTLNVNVFTRWIMADSHDAAITLASNHIKLSYPTWVPVLKKVERLCTPNIVEGEL